MTGNKKSGNQPTLKPANAPERKRVSDVVDNKMAELAGFYPEAQKIDLRAVTEFGDVLILGCVIVEEFTTEFGTHPMAVVAINTYDDPDGKAVFTFPVSAQVILDKLRQLKAKEAFPIVGRFFKDLGKRYYDLE